MRWGLEQRLEFVDFRLYWEGGINRSDITDRFGVSVPQASKDLTLYAAKAPGNLLYDKSAKRYVAASTFQPVFFVPDADRYLAQLRSVADHTVKQDDTWLFNNASAEVMPIPHRRVDVDVLRSILSALRRRRAIKILYQSMNPQRPKPMWRWISPHALGNDGLRWHVRAYCHTDDRFTDFIVSRCLNSEGDDAQKLSADQDVDWREFFGVVLVPNPLLSKAQQDIIAQDYCMKKGQIAIPVRKALLYYFRKRLRLDVATAMDNARETPVVLANKKEFNRAILEVETH
ncbi:WYL domain-containing protein [Terracidiphilus sp.]|uniref:WYL domain-containing protein n=1 Tax=Terracidiphilus sp. TaxID=1964191 RepID=UPI003C226F92